MVQYVINKTFCTSEEQIRVNKFTLSLLYSLLCGFLHGCECMSPSLCRNQTLSVAFAFIRRLSVFFIITPCLFCTYFCFPTLLTFIFAMLVFVYSLLIPIPDRTYACSLAVCCAFVLFLLIVVSAKFCLEVGVSVRVALYVIHSIQRMRNG